MYKFMCPVCQFELEAQEKWAGEKAKCDNCGHRMIIPSPDGLVTSERRQALAAGSELKECPHCHKMIKALASRCKHCCELVAENNAGPVAQTLVIPPKEGMRRNKTREEDRETVYGSNNQELARKIREGKLRGRVEDGKWYVDEHSNPRVKIKVRIADENPEGK